VPPPARGRPVRHGERLAQVLQKVLVVVVAGQPGERDEAVALVEAAVSRRVGAAQVAAGGPRRNRLGAEQLDQAAADAGATPRGGDQDVAQPGGARHDLADRHRDQLAGGADLDHHRPARPVEAARAEDVAVGGWPLPGQEAADLVGLGAAGLVGEPAGGRQGRARGGGWGRAPAAHPWHPP
jgi:hypothetical protein